MLCATLAGAEDFVEIERWGDRKLDFLRRFLPFARRHSLARHAQRRDQRPRRRRLFSACFVSWVAGLRDGDPTSSRSTARPRGAPTTGQGPEPAASGLGLGHAPAARAGPAGVGGEVQRDHRHPGLLRTPGTDRRAGHHRRHGLPDRDRRSDPRQGCRLPPGVEGQLAGALRPRSSASSPTRRRPRSTAHETTDGDHGRIEVRRHAVCHDVDWLALGPPLPRRAALPGPRHDRHGRGRNRTRRQASLERRYYLSSAKLSRQALRRRRARPLGLENRLHWVLDVVFHDDLMRLRTDNGPANMAAVRHMSLNLIRPVNDKASLKVRRKTIAWDDEYLARSPHGRPCLPQGFQSVTQSAHRRQSESRFAQRENLGMLLEKGKFAAGGGSHAKTAGPPGAAARRLSRTGPAC